MNKLVFVILTVFVWTSVQADDLKIADDFKSGDLVSAETFNQIFDTIEKINRTVKDSDLVGVWSCNAMTTRSTTDWTNKGMFYILENAQVNLTASSAATSLEGAYSVSTSTPSPFKRQSGSFTGTYVLYKNKLFTKHPDESDARIWDVNIVSPTRFELTFLETSAQSFPAQYSSFMTCDSATAVPAAPISPTIAQDGPNKTINVGWTDASNDESGFKVYRKLSSESEFSLLGTASTNTYADSTVMEGLTAYYRVVSYNENGESAKTKTVSVATDYTPPAVSSVNPADQSSLTSADAVSLPFGDHLSPIVSFGESVSITSSYVEVTNTSTSGTVSTIPLMYGNTIPDSYNHKDLVNTVTFYVEYSAGTTYQVKIKKDAIKDSAGNSLSADYVWSFSMQ